MVLGGERWPRAGAPPSQWPEGGNATARPSVVAVWKANGQIGR